MPPALSYAQRFEDLYLDLCFGEQSDGFYIDIGAGHPIYDNASFSSYLKGWRGVCVEPNPKLAQLGRAVRRRDTIVEALVSAHAGEAPFHLVDDFHGFSTMIETHAKLAHSEFGKASQVIMRPVSTLKAICEQHAPRGFEFLKVDVEGAEAEVIHSGDWNAFRPKVVIIEALAPYSLAPAWDGWEPLLEAHGYVYAQFDSLNRYYVAREETAILERIKSAPERFNAPQFRDFKPAHEDVSHPDHRLALLLAGLDPVRLPLLEPQQVTDHLLSSLLDVTDAQDAAGVCRLIFGSDPATQRFADFAADGTIRDLCLRIVESDPFRIACGRISASSAW